MRANKPVGPFIFSILLSASALTATTAHAAQPGSLSCPTVAGIAFVPVPEGDFRMGAQNGFFRDERPVNTVHVKPFCIAKRQLRSQDVPALVAALGNIVLGPDLSQPGAVETVLQSDGYEVPVRKRKSDFAAAIRNFQTDNHLPTTGVVDAATRVALEKVKGRKLSTLSQESEVTWFEAKALADALSRASGRRVRLPTEAEWERAARGDLVGMPTPWGGLKQRVDGRLISDIIDERLRGRCLEMDGPEAKPRPVPQNAFGLSELLTNWEWTSTLYAPYPYVAVDGREVQDSSKGVRSIRGNGGGNESCKISVSFRGYGDVSSQYSLRLAME